MNNLSVKITADLADLQSKFAVARAEVNAITSEMNKLARATASGVIDPATDTKLHTLAASLLQAKQETGKLADEMNKAGISANRFGSTVEHDIGGIGGAVERMSGLVTNAMQFTGVAVAIEAVRKLGDVIHDTAERANEIRSMSAVLEVTVTQFQAMQIAAEEAEISDQILFRGTERLVQSMADARDHTGAAIEKMHALGITNEQLSSSAFDTAHMLQYLSGRLRDDATASETLTALRKELGARSALVAMAIKELGDKTEDWNEKARKANALTKDQIEELHESGAWWANVGREISNTTAKLFVWITTQAKAADASMRARYDANVPGKDAKSGIIDRSADDSRIQNAKQSEQKITQATLEGVRDQIEATKQGSAERLALVRKFYEESAIYYGHLDVDRVQEAHRKLTAEERAYSEAVAREASQRYKLLMEADNKEMELLRKQLEESSKTLDQELSKETDGIAAREKLALIDIKGREDHLAAIARLGQINRAQEVDAQIQLENEKYHAESEGIDKRLALMQHDENERLKLLDQREQLERQHANAIQAIQDKAAEADITGWTRAVTEITAAESRFVSDMVTGRRTMSQSLLAITSNFIQQEIVSDLRALTTRYLLHQGAETDKKALEQGGLLFHMYVEAQKSAATTQGLATRSAAQATAQVEAKTQEAAAGATTVTSDAAKAYAGTFASIAQIPYVGWALAPAAAAAAFADVMSMSGLASMAVGAWDVPHDMVAQVHQGETVVPKTFAEGLRSGDGFGGDTHVHHWHISAVDGPSVERILRDHEGPVARVVKGMFDRGRFAGSYLNS